MITSPFPDVDIPDVTLFDLLFGTLDEADLDKTALIDSLSGTTTTYRALAADIEGLAGALAAAGVAPGSVVALLAPNSAAFVISFHAVLRAGAAATTVNALFTAADVAKQLRDSGATMLITVDALAPTARQSAEQAGIDASAVVVVDGPGKQVDGHPNLAELLALGAPAPTIDIDASRHVAVLPYSSGTTGMAKGVMLTHRNLVANVAQIGPALDLRRDDRILALLPFFHIYGMTVLLNASMAARAALVVVPKFQLEQLLETIQDHLVTFAFIAPPVALSLAKSASVDRYDLSSLDVVLSGAAPLDAALGRAVEQRLGVTVLQGYGMTELSPVSHIMPRDGGMASRGARASLDSCGWPVPNTRNKLVDPETGDEIDLPAKGFSATGELWVAGPNVMVGYLGNEEATREMLDADGFLHTGDLARLDSHGCVHVVDRLKELIKYKGYQVPPAELEALLITHPAVADAAVVGVQAEDGEEVPKAFIVRKEGHLLDEAAAMDFVALNVAPYKKIRQVEFIDAIPKSAAGKLLRRELRSLGMRMQ